MHSNYKIFYQDKTDASTQKALEYVKEHYKEIGELLSISLFRKDSGLGVVSFIGNKGCIVTYGFEWGNKATAKYLEEATELFDKKLPEYFVSGLMDDKSYMFIFAEGKYFIITP